MVELQGANSWVSDVAIDERRKFPRALSLKTGKIVSEVLAEPIDTAVLDLSEEGACLLVPDIADIPQAFQLVLDPGNRKLKCEVRWKSGYRIGVHFAEPPGLNLGFVVPTEPSSDAG
jgi:hypothetical protein